VNSYTYTEDDFTKFSERVSYWIDKFGITEYEYEISHEQLDNVCANTTYNCKSKLASFRLSKNITYYFCPQFNIDKLALHEVIHLLLADFGYTICETKDFDSDLAIAQEHQVVMRLIKAIGV
jgi:hypothetical protein